MHKKRYTADTNCFNGFRWFLRHTHFLFSFLFKLTFNFPIICRCAVFHFLSLKFLLSKL